MSDLFTLPTIVAGIMLISLNAYVLLGGADFGGGVWDLLATGSPARRAAQRELVAHALGPIWEANHVWLVLVVVLLFTAFPPVFSGLAIMLHIPLSLMLIGIVLRGSAFTFRTYGSEHDAAQRRWGRTFAIASVATPVLLGICIGAIASDAVGRSLGALSHPSVARQDFTALFVAPWLTPFTIGAGLLTLALFAFLAAVYLTVEAPDDALREEFRSRALATAVVVFVLAFALLALAPAGAPRMHTGLIASPWAIPFQIATAIAAVAALWALWTRRFRLARIAAAAQVTLILWGWAVAQYPFLVPPPLTIRGAAAPERTLELLLWALALGAAVLFPSLAYLFRIFKGRPEAFERMDERSPAQPNP
jgi:cytochrome d ubiquinol oxidase subunit II